MADSSSITNRRTLYVNGLSTEVTEQILNAAFIPFGPIEGVEIPIDYKTKKGVGHGFVEFEDEDDAKAAIDNMDDSELFGQIISVQISKGKRPIMLQEAAPGVNQPVWATEETAIARSTENKS